MLNKIGDREVPWGTSHVMSYLEQGVLLIFTYYKGKDKYDFISFNANLLIPILFIFDNNIS